jgi:hypothetical protein
LFGLQLDTAGIERWKYAYDAARDPSENWSLVHAILDPVTSEPEAEPRSLSPAASFVTKNALVRWKNFDAADLLKSKISNWPHDTGLINKSKKWLPRTVIVLKG